MTAKPIIPNWKPVETTTGISRDGMFAVVVEVWAAKNIQRFATFISERSVLGFKCPTTTQMRLSDSPPTPDYDELQPSGDRREAHALACCQREAWKIIKRKLGNTL